jgi:putative FmdB family regulatory protein
MTQMIREFECQSCGHEFEELVEKDEVPPCPKCESTDVKETRTAHPKHSSWGV